MSVDAIPTSQDRFLNGRMILRQPLKGHRIGTDALLLAASVPRGRAEIVDLGAGVGGAGIAAALRLHSANLSLVERDADIAELARQNLALNHLEARAKVLVIDLFASARVREASGLLPRSADLVLTNPPFLMPGKGKESPDQKRKAAHVMAGGDLTDWVRAAAHCLRPNGSLVMIHRADAIHEILIALQGRFGDVRLLPVHPSSTQVANRLLVRATLASRARTLLLPFLCLHAENGSFTPNVEQIHQGEAIINWENGGIHIV